MNGWKTLTDMEVNAESIKRIEQYCSELLIHAADVEGLCQGIDEELVTGEYTELSHLVPVPWTSSCSGLKLTCSSRLMGFHPVHVRRRCEGAGRPGAR